jgi:hypothetical protein
MIIVKDEWFQMSSTNVGKEGFPMNVRWLELKGRPTLFIKEERTLSANVSCFMELVRFMAGIPLWKHTLGPDSIVLQVLRHHKNRSYKWFSNSLKCFNTWASRWCKEMKKFGFVQRVKMLFGSSQKRWVESPNFLMDRPIEIFWKIANLHSLESRACGDSDSGTKSG